MLNYPNAIMSNAQNVKIHQKFIFMIDRFEFSNTLAHGVQKARSDNGVFPDKKIKMRVWAINLEKKK